MTSPLPVHIATEAIRHEIKVVLQNQDKEGQDRVALNLTLSIAKEAVLSSLNSADGQRGIDTPSMSSLIGIALSHAWRSNRIVVLRYRSYLEAPEHYSRVPLESKRRAVEVLDALEAVQ